LILKSKDKSDAIFLLSFQLN